MEHRKRRRLRRLKLTPKSSRKGDFFLYRYVMPKWSVFLAILWRSADGLRSMLAVPSYALVYERPTVTQAQAKCPKRKGKQQSKG